jgi:hypothetical protein
LREDAGSNEVQIRDITRVHHAAACEYLPEDQQPERWLEGTGNEFHEVVAQLAQLKLGDHKRLKDEAGRCVDVCTAHGVGLTKPLFRGAFG